MNKTELRQIENWFFTYVAMFRVNDELPPISQIKHEHSLRVAREMKMLAEEMQWPDEEVRTAYALGILHDVGRFSQFAEFGTIVDHQSVDHAKRGVEVLEQEKILMMISEKDRGIIHRGVCAHNIKCVPSDVSPDHDKFVKLVRDADKLDGFWIIYDALAVGKNSIYATLFKNRSLTDKASPALVESIKQGKMISYADTHCLADYLLLQMGWVFDLNYAASMRCVRERRVIELFPTYLPADKGILEASRAVLAYRDKFLAV
ncbi:MAG: HD domain-containing protein [Candidatus Omnitrophica bacterium]|nr:HD domain-containing protein [Candidatus Omnitrophota bacterium]MDD5671452.1 HD domain-containing protein [Candidatus Omnitrophota bacterium]